MGEKTIDLVLDLLTEATVEKWGCGSIGGTVIIDVGGSTFWARQEGRWLGQHHGKLVLHRVDAYFNYVIYEVTDFNNRVTVLDPQVGTAPIVVGYLDEPDFFERFLEDVELKCVAVTKKYQKS